MDTLRYKYPVLYAHYSDSLEEESELYQEYFRFLASKRNLLPNIEMYFGDRLHDSWVTSIDRGSDRVTIALNEFGSHCFADALEYKFDYGVPHHDRVFPLELRFTSVEHFSISWIRKSNEIISLNEERYLPRLSEYLYDQIARLDEDAVEVGLIFWSTKRKGNPIKRNPILVQIRAKKIAIIEQQREAFLSLYGGKFLELFDIFWSENQRVGFFDDTTALRLIDENT